MQLMPFLAYKDITDLRNFLSGKLADKRVARAALEGITPSSTIDDLPMAGSAD